MMDFFRRQWNVFREYIISNKKAIITKYIIFACVSFVLLLIDLLTKELLFDVNKQGEVIHENFLFGIRSKENRGLTFLPLNTASGLGIISLFNIIILIACLISLLFIRTPWIAIFIAFIFSGSLGNTVDRFAFNYVRDIIFIPWFDKGTFNFADMDVIIGSIGLTLSYLFLFIIGFERR